jgi:hypothetical protein
LTDLEDDLEKLPHRMRVAFAVACASRVLRIYELDYSDSDRGPHQAIDTAWAYACGAEISPEKLSAVRQSVTAATPNIEAEGDEFTAPMLACVSAIYALDSMEDETTKSSLRASSTAREAVDCFTEFDGKGTSEELKWQMDAAHYALTWVGRPVTREMFGALNLQQPGWLARIIQ